MPTALSVARSRLSIAQLEVADRVPRWATRRSWSALRVVQTDTLTLFPTHITKTHSKSRLIQCNEPYNRNKLPVKKLTDVNVGFVNRARGYHWRHTVASETVSQYRRHHRVTIWNVLSTFLAQRHNHLVTRWENNVVRPITVQWL